MKQVWWKEAVVYQVYPRSFYDSNGDGIGDLRGIMQKLDYLSELGIDVIWLNPIYKSPNADNGYDISDYYDIMDEFGTMADFEELLEEVHKRGMKLIMDLVVNHTSDEHPWFTQSRSSITSSYRDYYIWRSATNGREPNNWISAFSGPAWEYDTNTDQYYLHVYAAKQPDLNWENPKVREDVYSMMKWWLNKGIDGFRMDVINVISKVQHFPDDKGPVGGHRRKGSRYYLNGPQVHEYLQEMNREVLCKYDIMTVGETPKVNPYIARYYVNEERHELDMLIHFELMDLDHGALGKYDFRSWSLADFKRVMYSWHEGLQEKGWNANYFSNHDQPRALSRFGNDKEYRVESAKMLATLLLTWPGTPFIYQGEEIGMTNVAFPSIQEYNDIETLNMYHERAAAGENPQTLMQLVHLKSRDNARTPMQWNNGENAGFTTGSPWLRLNPNYKQINVDQALRDPDSVFYYYKKLIRLRKKTPALVYGNCQMFWADDEQVFGYTRELSGQQVAVMLNFTDKTLERRLPDSLVHVKMKLLAGTHIMHQHVPNGYVQLVPYEARVYTTL